MGKPRRVHPLDAPQPDGARPPHMLSSLPSPMPLLDTIHPLYDRLAAQGQATPIHPFIGSAFASPSDSTLRVMAIGINAYVDEQHSSQVSGSSFGEWFATGKYRYQRAAWTTLDALARGLVAGPYRLGHLAHAGMDSIYLTNAIKTYLPTAVGKHAHQVAEPQYDAHLPTFRDELRILAEHGAFPHAIVVIGAPFWSRSCDTLALGATFGPARIVSRTHFPGRLVHHANRLEVQSGERTSTVWHLRVKHPAGRSKKGSAAWLLGQGELAGAGVTSVAV